jgi:rubredoxin
VPYVDRMPADRSTFPPGTPERFTIIPDDYHVPLAGTTGDGKQFFLSNELFGGAGHSDEVTSFIGLFFWNADGRFESVEVDAVSRPAGIPPMQAVQAGSEEALNRAILKLGDYVLESIEVEPFAVDVRGVTFGFVPERLGDEEISITVQPGNFIAYYEPWDGEEYDT